MRIKISALYAVFTVLSIFMLFSCSGNDLASGEWVAKIDGNAITQGELDTLYYAQQRQIYETSNEEIDKMAADPDSVRRNPTLNKSEFLENLIRQRLVYDKAMEGDVLKNIEVKALIKMATEAVVVGHYVKEKFKNDINVDDTEIAAIYAQQKDKLRGVPIDQAEQYIRQQVQQQKLQGKLREYVEGLKDIARIEKNEEVLKKMEKNPSEEILKEPAPAKEEKKADASVKAPAMEEKKTDTSVKAPVK